MRIKNIIILCVLLLASINMVSAGDNLPYYIQDTTDYPLWFNISSIPADSTVIYSATKEGSFTPNGTETFPLYDNFTGILSSDPHLATAVSLTRNEDAYVYNDFGVDHFNGFDINFTMNQTGGTAGIVAVMVLANSIDDAYNLPSPAVNVIMHESGGDRNIWLNRGPQTAFDKYIGSANTDYYCTLSRTADSDTITLKIYSDSDRTNLLDTLSVSGFGTSTKYRYLYAMDSWNTGSVSALSGYSKDISIDGGSLEDLTTYTEVDPNSRIDVSIGYALDASIWNTEYAAVTIDHDAGTVRIVGTTNGKHGTIYADQLFDSGICVWNTTAYQQTGSNSHNAGVVYPYIETTSRDIFYWRTNGAGSWSEAALRVNDSFIETSSQEGVNAIGTTEVYFAEGFGKVVHDGDEKVNRTNADLHIPDGMRPWMGTYNQNDGYVEADLCFVANLTTNDPTVIITDMGSYYKITVINNEAFELDNYQIKLNGTTLGVIATDESWNIELITLTISDQTPGTPYTSHVNRTVTFSATTSETTNNIWKVNGITVETDSSTTAPSYTNSSAVVGSHNVSLTATSIADPNVSDSYMWIWNATTDLTAPTLLSPVNGSTQTLDFPPLLHDTVFNWNDTGAPSYKYEVSSDPDFNLLAGSGYSTINTTTISLVADDYWWRIYAYDPGSGNLSDSSTVFNFTIEITEPTIEGTAINGVVYEVLDGGSQDVSGALVSIYNSTWSDSLITGANGYYLFKNLKESDTYSLQTTKQGYVDSSIELVTTINNSTVTRNILLERRSGAGDQYDFHYVKFTLKNIFDTRYSDVDVKVYEIDNPIEIFTGVTGEDGSITFILNRDQEYTLTFIDASQGIDESLTLYPKEDHYNVYVITKSIVPDDDYSSEELDITVSKQNINSTHAYINITYLDNLAETTALNIYLNQSVTNNLFNQTVIDSYSGVSNSTTVSFVVEDYAGQTYFVNIDIDHITFGDVQRSYAVNFDGMEDAHGFSQVYIWLAIGGIMFSGMIFKATNARQGAFVVCVVAWVFIILGWFDNLGDKGALAITAGVTLATILSIAAIMAKGEKEG